MIDKTQKEKWMFSALGEAKKAEKIDEVPIGAIIIPAKTYVKPP